MKSLLKISVIEPRNVR